MGGHPPPRASWGAIVPPPKPDDSLRMAPGDPGEIEHKIRGLNALRSMPTFSGLDLDAYRDGFNEALPSRPDPLLMDWESFPQRPWKGLAEILVWSTAMLFVAVGTLGALLSDAPPFGIVFGAILTVALVWRVRRAVREHPRPEPITDEWDARLDAVREAYALGRITAAEMDEDVGAIVKAQADGVSLAPPVLASGRCAECGVAPSQKHMTGCPHGSAYGLHQTLAPAQLRWRDDHLEHIGCDGVLNDDHVCEKCGARFERNGRPSDAPVLTLDRIDTEPELR